MSSWTGGPIDLLSGAKGLNPNRVSKTIEVAILQPLGHISVSAQRMGQDRTQRGAGELERPPRLEETVGKRKLTFSEEPVRLLNCYSPEPQKCTSKPASPATKSLSTPREPPQGLCQCIP